MDMIPIEIKIETHSKWTPEEYAEFIGQNGYDVIKWQVLKAAFPLVYLEARKVKTPEMTAAGAVEIIKLLENNGIEVYVDGGWGVDALLGGQTRKHEDLDIALPHKFVPLLRELFEARGYKEVPRPDSWECNFVLGDNQGYLIDVHSYTFDENGENTFGVAYEPRHLTGTGIINEYPVKCPPPDVMVEFHTGYDVDKDDYHDTKALCERFDMPLPKDYERFEKT